MFSSRLQLFLSCPYSQGDAKRGNDNNIGSSHSAGSRDDLIIMYTSNTRKFIIIISIKWWLITYGLLYNTIFTISWEVNTSCILVRMLTLQGISKMKYVKLTIQHCIIGNGFKNFITLMEFVYIWYLMGSVKMCAPRKQTEKIFPNNKYLAI